MENCEESSSFSFGIATPKDHVMFNVQHVIDLLLDKYKLKYNNLPGVC